MLVLFFLPEGKRRKPIDNYHLQEYHETKDIQMRRFHSFTYFFHSFDKHLACNNKRCMQLVENTGDIWTEQGLGVKNVGQHMEGKERHRIGVGGGWKSCRGSRNVTVGQYGEESEGLKEGRRLFRKREK